MAFRMAPQTGLVSRAWSLVVATVHRTVALCRSSFESVLAQKQQNTIRLDGVSLLAPQTGLDSRAAAGAWSLAVATVHRTVALCRSSFESILAQKQQNTIQTDGVSLLAPQTGLEPVTPRLTAACSTD